jgi:hypothetical protein
METWMIVAVVIAIAIALYFMMRNKPTAIALTSTIAPTAPGVSASTGQVPNYGPTPGTNSPPAIGVLQHIPLVGGLASGVFHGTTNAVLALDKGVGNVLDHVPVVGHTLSTVNHAAASVVNKVFSIF